MTLNVMDYSPILWLDASSPETLTLDVNGSVGTWLDKSGNNNRFNSVNPLGGLRPTLIGGGVFFDRTAAADTGTIINHADSSAMRCTGDYLFAPPKTVFMVISQSSLSTRAMDSLIFGYSGSFEFIGLATNKLYANINQSIKSVNYSVSYNPEHVNIITASILSSSMSARINKTSAGSVLVNPVSYYSSTYLGIERLLNPVAPQFPGNPYKGFIHEVIICGSLSSTDIAEIEQYLIDKWRSSISGTVFERVNGQPTPGAYPIYVYERESGNLVGSTTSAADGTYLITGLNEVEHYVMAIDNTSPIQRSAIVDKVVPS
jgi:hypothetical protein